MANANPGGIYGQNQLAQPQINSLGPQFQNDSAPQNPIGGMIRWNNQLLRYVKHAAGTGAVTPAAGAPAYAKVLTPGATATAVPVVTVTADQTDSVMGLKALGTYMQFTTAPTDGYYIWIIVAGVANCKVAGAIAGDKLIGSATDNQFDIIAAGSAQTYPLLGTVCGASSGGLSPTMLQDMDW